MIRFLTTAIVAFTLSGAALAQTRELSTSGVALDRVIAIVNEGIVLQSQMDNQMTLITDRLRGQGTQMPPADVLRQQVLERPAIAELAAGISTLTLQHATVTGLLYSVEARPTPADAWTSALPPIPGTGLPLTRPLPANGNGGQFRVAVERP